MASVINGKSPISGNSSGSWNRGPSAYELAVKYQNYKGDVISWLESLKAFSPVIGNITKTENGVSFTITDETGEHVINLLNGKDLTIKSAEIIDETGVTKIIFSDDTEIMIPKGVKGDKGDAPIIQADDNGIVYYSYPDNQEREELINLGEIVKRDVLQEYKDNPPVRVVDELPSPEDAIDGVIYIVKEGD